MLNFYGTPDASKVERVSRECNIHSRERSGMGMEASSGKIFSLVMELMDGGRLVPMWHIMWNDGAPDMVASWKAPHVVIASGDS